MSLRITALPSTSGRCGAQHVQQLRSARSPRQQQQHRIGVVQAAAAAATPADGTQQVEISPDLAKKTVLILGGSGRVGSSTASAMIKRGIGGTVIVGGRSRESMAAAVERRPELRDAQFRQADVDDPSALLRAMEGVDLVVHTAGPFQRKETCSVLEAAIAAGVPYVDVCDDTDYSQRAKALGEKAKAAGVPAITTAGIYPGVSNVMAAHMISIARKEYDDQGRYKQREAGQGTDPKRLLYSYFTAGTGGAGPTILETSLLLAGEDVVAFKDGERLSLPPVSNLRFADFGVGVGRRSVWLYNLPEVLSSHQTLGVPSCSARFGTDPDLWNWAMWLTARVFPRSFLNNRDAVRGLVALLDPLVRPLDALVGEKVAMKVEVDMEDGTNATGLYVAPRLSESVGVCTAAFVHNMLAGGCEPGVWFPEEREAVRDRKTLLLLAGEGAARFILNKPAWALDSEPVKVGLGFYL